MRQLIFQVPRGSGQRVADIARQHDGSEISTLAATDDGRAVDLVLVHVPNRQVEGLLHDVEPVPDLRITLNPHGVLVLRPPADRAPDQVTNVEPRSPVEVYLDGLQSVGTWTGFTCYALAGGLVVWIGLYTNTVFLLTAAMLIAPYAGPAMNLAVGTARGDLSLIGRSAARYFAGLLISIAAAFVMSWALQQETTTELMTSTSLIPSVAVALPLVAGFAGALNLCQSERNSLVSGAATGILVAASLAPPAGVVGMSLAIGDWTMAKAAAFLLILQFVGINVSGAVTFRLFGLSPRGARYERGRPWAAYAAWALSLALLAGLLLWQFDDSPALQRGTLSQRAAADVRQTIDNSGLAHTVMTNVLFTRADIPNQNTLLAQVYVQPAEPSGSTEQLRRELTALLQSTLAARYNATPLVDVTVLQPPPAQ